MTYTQQQQQLPPHVLQQKHMLQHLHQQHQLQQMQRQQQPPQHFQQPGRPLQVSLPVGGGVSPSAVSPGFTAMTPSNGSTSSSTYYMDGHQSTLSSPPPSSTPSSLPFGGRGLGPTPQVTLSSSTVQQQRQQEQQQIQLQLQLQQQQQQLQQQPQHHSQPLQAPQSPQMQPQQPVQSVLHPGMSVMRLITMNEIMNNRRPSDNSIIFWQRFVNEFFAGSGMMKYSLQNSITSNTRSFEINANLLARYYKTSFDTGMRTMQIIMEDPKEFLLPNNMMLMDSHHTQVISSFDNNVQVHSYGHLRVTFLPGTKKIHVWEFHTQKHLEYVPKAMIYRQLSAAIERQSVSAAEIMPVSPVNEFGITVKTMRCLEISEVVTTMKDLMEYSDVFQMGPLDSLKTFVQDYYGGQNLAGGANGGGSEHQNVTTSSPNTSSPTSKRRRSTGDGKEIKPKRKSSKTEKEVPSGSATPTRRRSIGAKMPPSADGEAHGVTNADDPFPTVDDL